MRKSGVGMPTDCCDQEQDMLEVAAASTPTLEILSEQVTTTEMPVFDTGNSFPSRGVPKLAR